MWGNGSPERLDRCQGFDDLQSPELWTAQASLSDCLDQFLQVSNQESFFKQGAGQAQKNILRAVHDYAEAWGWEPVGEELDHRLELARALEVAAHQGVNPLQGQSYFNPDSFVEEARQAGVFDSPIEEKAREYFQGFAEPSLEGYNKAIEASTEDGGVYSALVDLDKTNPLPLDYDH